MAELHSALTVVIMVMFSLILSLVLLLIYSTPLSSSCFSLPPLSLIFMKINFLSAYFPLSNHNNTLSDGNKKEEQTTIYHTLSAFLLKEAVTSASLAMSSIPTKRHIHAVLYISNHIECI